MFSKNAPSSTIENKNGIPSIIGGDVVIQGNVTSQGLVQLDGKFEGEIRIHSLTVGEQGWVDGVIDAQEIIIKGKVTGNVFARNRVKIKAGSTVIGDVHYGEIELDPGAHLSGHLISTTDNEQDN